jgi:UDP-N-acetylglucosamine 2-epimerase (non-hydrolysing)
LGVPVLVLRDTTERPEGIEAGTLKLAGNEEQPIYEMATELLTDRASYEKMAKAVNPYGDGLASERIASALLYYFKQNDKRPEAYRPE